MASNDELGRLVLLVVGLLVLLPFVMMVLMVPFVWFGGGFDGMHHGMGSGAGGAWIALLWLFALAFVVVVGYLLYRASRSLDVAPAAGEDEEDPAMAELRMAYARGDLSDEEFERRRERLQSD